MKQVYEHPSETCHSEPSGERGTIIKYCGEEIGYVSTWCPSWKQKAMPVVRGSLQLALFITAESVSSDSTCGVSVELLVPSRLTCLTPGQATRYPSPHISAEGFLGDRFRRDATLGFQNMGNIRYM